MKIIVEKKREELPLVCIIVMNESGRICLKQMYNESAKKSLPSVLMGVLEIGDWSTMAEFIINQEFGHKADLERLGGFWYGCIYVNVVFACGVVFNNPNEDFIIFDKPDLKRAVKKNEIECGISLASLSFFLSLGT